MKTTLKLQSHCVYDTRYQLVLATHKRKKLLTPRAIERFEALARERAAAWDGEVLSLDAEPDYVSLHISLPPTASVAGFVGALKTGTSRRLRNEFASLARSKQVWSDRYLVLSANGVSSAEAVAAFLAGDRLLAAEMHDDDPGRHVTQALAQLTSTAAEFVRKRPDDARLVVAAALEAAARQHDRDTEANGSRAVRADAGASDNELIDAPEAARRLGISRGSVYYRVKTGKLIAWPLDGRGSLAIPAEQITDDGQVLAGIAEVLEAAGHSERAWRHLSTPRGGNGRSEPPLRALKSGRIDEALRGLTRA